MGDRVCRKLIAAIKLGWSFVISAKQRPKSEISDNFTHYFASTLTSAPLSTSTSLLLVQFTMTSPLNTE